MSHTSKSTKREPVYLSLHVERPDRQIGDEAYAHVMLQFCKRRDDGGAPAPSWPMNSRYGGEPGTERMDIGFSAQIDSRAHLGQLSYAWTVGLVANGASNAHPIHPEVVQRSAKELAKLTRAYRKAADTFGEAKTFGQFVAYTLSGLTVAGVFERSERGDGEPWRLHDALSPAYVIDSRVQEMAVACRKAMGKSDDLATAA